MRFASHHAPRPLRARRLVATTPLIPVCSDPSDPLDPDEVLRPLLARCREGDERASAELLGLLYDHLHRIARGCMRGQAPGHTLQPTALVGEAYLRLAGNLADLRDERHFLRLAARAMRQILVDHDRRSKSGRRPPPEGRLEFDLVLEQYGERAIDVRELDGALDRLEVLDPRLARLVELHFFAGRTMAECAEILEVSERQAFRWWKAARAFLHRELSG